MSGVTNRFCQLNSARIIAYECSGPLSYMAGLVFARERFIA